MPTLWEGGLNHMICQNLVLRGWSYVSDSTLIYHSITTTSNYVKYDIVIGLCCIKHCSRVSWLPLFGPAKFPDFSSIFTVHNSSCGKAIFLQVSVCPWGRGVCVHPPGRPPLGQTRPPGRHPLRQTPPPQGRHPQADTAPLPTP